MTTDKRKSADPDTISAWVRMLSGNGPAADTSALLKHLWFAFQRRRAGFDWILARHCKRIRPRIQPVLWWALTECYALSGLPAPVAVSMAAEWTKKRFSANEGAFVNAVLRNILRECADDQALRALINTSAPPAVRLELPGLLYERWRAAFGAAGAARIAAVCQLPAEVTARRRGSLAETRFPAGGVMMSSQSDFATEDFYIQDASTLMAPLLLDPRPGEQLADLCAAPGGKSLIIAERLGGEGRLFCRDREPLRLQQLHENLDGFGNVDIAAGDAACPQLPAGALDGVLLDVPCSNSGVLRRRPDVRWNFTAAKLRELLPLQAAILDGAAPLVKPGGRLVYSTCSIEADENAAQVAEFLKRHPDFALETAHQLLPTKCHDGAFAARLRKKS